MERFFSLSTKVIFIGILVIFSLTITGFSVYSIYRTASESLKMTLIDILHRQASVISVMKEQGKSNDEILTFFRLMRKKYYKMGETGEIVIAWKPGDSISYFLSSKPSITYEIPFYSKGVATPMKFALSGLNGYGKGYDYRGVKVYAAYMYIPETKWGLVAKISAEEVDKPYIKTSIYAFVVSLILISFCGIAFLRINNRFTKKISESEEKFRSLFENITEGVALHEIVYENKKPVNYRIIDANPAFETNTLINYQSAIGSLATDLYNTENPPYFSEFHKVAITRQPYRFETFFPNLKKHFIINVISPKKGQFATVFEDITEQKAVEHEMKLKNEELNRFIYTVSHDLKSPLVTIKMFTSYIAEDIENGNEDALQKDIMYIQNAADKMGKLLNELLELSRIGRKEDQKENISLHDVVQTAVDLLAGPIRVRGVNVKFNGSNIILHGYVSRFIQLFQNLLDNAIKFMDEQPEPTIEIGTLIDKSEIVFFVKDNGSGIEPVYHQKIFNLFEKLETETEGTGIGLALVKRIVDVHEGHIWLKSEGKGKGTIFYFTLSQTKMI